MICGSGFKRFYLSENPIEQIESYVSVHNVVNIYLLFFHNVVNIYNKKFILMLTYVLRLHLKAMRAFSKRHLFGFEKDVAVLFGLITSLPRERGK